MPPKALRRQATSTAQAWEMAARENKKGRERELRRMSPREDGEASSSKDTNKAEPKSPKSAGASAFSVLKMKAMAAKMRKKIAMNSKNGGEYSARASYSVLDTQGLDPGSPSEGPEPGERGKSQPSLSSWERNQIALSSILIHPFSLLLLAFPFGIASELKKWGAMWTFWLNIVALVPLAKILGDGTEELAAAIKNDTISGLLNATLGNAVEMILSVQTLRKGLLDVVKATLLGSILSNILLVLGTSFLLGGLVGSDTLVGKHHVIYDSDYTIARCTCEKEQIFSSKSAMVNMGLQLLACMTCALPTVFANVGADPSQEASNESIIIEVSRISAVIIMTSYIAYIVFQLITHKNMLTLDEGNDSEEEGDDEEVGLGAIPALALMAFTTFIIAFSSEMLVGAIEEVTQSSSLSGNFIGIILLPFAGNACEHASAVRFAIQDRPGLSIGIAVGSSTQIALFVVPFTVVMGWALNQPMDLVFGKMNTAVMILSVLVALTMVMDGRANWLKGFMLCTAYLFEAVLYWSTPT